MDKNEQYIADWQNELAAAAARQQAMAWQPIETAPKDGTEILGWRKDCGILLVRWTNCESFMTDREMEESGLDDEAIFASDWFCADFVSGGRLEGSEAPTHWMPLPAPPLAANTEAKARAERTSR